MTHEDRKASQVQVRKRMMDSTENCVWDVQHVCTKFTYANQRKAYFTYTHEVILPSLQSHTAKAHINSIGNTGKMTLAQIDSVKSLSLMLINSYLLCNKIVLVDN